MMSLPGKMFVYTESRAFTVLQYKIYHFLSKNPLFVEAVGEKFSRIGIPIGEIRSFLSDTVPVPGTGA
jgi:hypothetical protein